MSRSRPSLSITLPTNFEIPYDEGQLPKTPDQQEEPQTAKEPPPPPRQKFSVKRRRAEHVPSEQRQPLPDFDTVIPTIEMSEAVSEFSSPMIQPMAPTNDLLSPIPSFQRLLTPKTPCARVNAQTPLESPGQEWAMINDKTRPSLQRSASICSTFSDSSVSSGGSSGFSAPTGNCTSPESVATDPFMEDDIKKADKLILSPSEKNSSPSAKRVKRHRHVRWTPEMDQHLENTYIRYLSDPRVTPFKTLPGVPPPLGVCNRVAARARHTWSQQKASTPSSLDTILEVERSQRQGSPDTIRPEPAGNKDAKQQSQWPRSDAATRKRLRKLVKGKPALSAHYQRLLRTRSPSPFPSSSSANRSSEPPLSSFTSSEMKMSLITSTATSMQPDGPLAQLASDDSIMEQPTARPQSQRSSRPTDWFSRIGRSQAHQKSLSLQSGLSLDTSSEALNTTKLLASPFDEISNRSHLLHSMSTTKSLGRSEFNKSGKGPSLDSPFEVKGAPTMPRSLKRRFKSDEEKPRRPVLEDVFGPPSDEANAVRSRGFTVGALQATDNLTKMFDPPASSSSPSIDQEMTEAPLPSDLSYLGPIGSRSAPRRLAEPVPRLGSPFMETPSANHVSNTFPRRYVPTPSNPQPFQERLRELAARNNLNQGNTEQ